MGKDYIENLSGPKELLSQERLNTIAADQDLTVVVPPDDVLILDLDSEEAYSNFLRKASRFEQIGECTLSWITTKSRSGNRHAYVRIVSNSHFGGSSTERLALQLMLGSDETKETLSYFRLQHGIDPVSCLFETNAEINRVNKFLRKDKEF